MSALAVDYVQPSDDDTSTPAKLGAYLRKLVARMNDQVPPRRKVARIDGVTTGNASFALASPGFSVAGVSLIGFRRTDAASSYTSAPFVDFQALGDGRLQLRFVNVPASGRYVATLEVIEDG